MNTMKEKVLIVIAVIELFIIVFGLTQYNGLNKQYDKIQSKYKTVFEENVTLQNEYNELQETFDYYLYVTDGNVGD